MNVNMQGAQQAGDGAVASGLMKQEGASEPGLMSPSSTTEPGVHTQNPLDILKLEPVVMGHFRP